VGRSIDGLFDDDTEYTGPDLTPRMIADAEQGLGVALPAAYLDLLRVRNGGSLLRCVFATPFPTSWDDDNFEVRAILGIGGEDGIDAPEGGSRYLIEEWGYPPIGVVFAVCPSGGHDTVMLDYAKLNGGGEPTVAYVDEDRIPRTVADGFEAFVAGLRARA